MKQVTYTVACLVLLVAVAGMPVGLTSQGAKTPPPIPTFDGNVANIVWGGRIESIPGFKPEDGWRRNLISEVSSWTSIAGKPGPKDVVVSFFKRESVFVGSVTVVSMPLAHGVKDLEIWTSPTSAEAGWPAEELPPGDYKVVVKAGGRDLVAPRVKVTLGQTTTLKIAFKKNQLVLE